MHKFNPDHAARLLDPERRAWLNPEEILTALGLRPGMRFADVGAGPGFFSVPAAEMVGASGRVYALDVQQEVIAMLEERAKAMGLTNLETLVSAEDRLPLSDAAVDAALLVNVLHEVGDRLALIREVARSIRPGGVIGVVEWRKESMAKGPAFSDRLSAAEIEATLRAAGFDDIEPLPAGPYHDGRKARKPPSAD
jgi:ubiquinone/menaquinone biosynthesis C-methylase UbiE